MARFLSLVSQSGADVATNVLIDTGLTTDSKTGLLITEIECHWVNGKTAVAADYSCSIVLGTLPTGAPGFNSADEIARIEWACQNTAGVAVAFPIEPVKQYTVPEGRLTAQPSLYLTLTSVATGQSNVAAVRVYYEVVKLSDLEVMRLLVGGA
jgi:hypothetical protein